jgi:hypothetical protein
MNNGPELLLFSSRFSKPLRIPSILNPPIPVFIKLLKSAPNGFNSLDRLEHQQEWLSLDCGLVQRSGQI